MLITAQLRNITVFRVTKVQGNYIALVWNCTKEVVNTKMQGAWFVFKPDMKKAMDDAKCRFITENRKDTGLVILPDQFDPMSELYVEGFDKTPEGQAILETKRLEGVENLLTHHREIIRNNQVSLRKDMAAKFPQGDQGRMIALEMSPGELASLQIVAKYQREKQDTNDTKIREINKLLEQVGPLSE